MILIEYMNFIPYDHSIKDFKIYGLSSATFCVELVVTLEAFINYNSRA